MRNISFTKFHTQTRIIYKNVETTGKFSDPLPRPPIDDETIDQPITSVYSGQPLVLLCLH
eukprot:snap_masked-scaffold_12-processed-gene-3.40-mRNA-1 protein AED:1.00 eAED:1.00 QI:0/0/0/0/1/1/2/0/59